jgi:hypothetical protein
MDVRSIHVTFAAGGIGGAMAHNGTLRSPLSPTSAFQNVLSRFNFSQLDDLRSAFGAPSAKNGMNGSAAQAEYVQRAAEWIRFTFLTPLGGVIFDHNDDVHTRIFHELVLPGRKRRASCT